MYQPVKIAPSILSADFMNLGSDIAMIEEAGAGYVHVDVMDGHFVPNLTMGVPLLKQLACATDLVMDVHLMIDNPLVGYRGFSRRARSRSPFTPRSSTATTSCVRLP